MKAIALFSVAAVLLVALLLLPLRMLFPGEAAQHALLISAIVGLLVQVVAFAMVKLASVDNVMTARLLGTILRFLVLIIYTFVVVRGSEIQALPALIGLATFFFACTLLETIFLRK